MMNEDFRKLKRYLVRLNTVVNELDVLEDWVGVDYSDVATDVGYAAAMLEQRRESLQRRGRRL